MKRILILFAAVASAFAQQSFDFSSLDKLGAKAKEKTAVTLDANLIKLAAGFIGKDDRIERRNKLQAELDELRKTYMPNHPQIVAAQKNLQELEKEADVKSLVEGLKSVDIRSWEFDSEGQYSAADVAPLRAWAKSLQWSKIVDVQSRNESSEIYVQPMSGGSIGGLIIISAEPKELTVVAIMGAIKMSDIGKLGGNLGIPDMTLLYGGGKAPAKDADASK